MLKSIAIGFTLLLSLPAYGITDFYKDVHGDVKVKEPAFAALDIQTIKVSTPDRKNFVFEIKTKGIPVSTKGNPIYYVLAVNQDGDYQTGNNMWVAGQEVCRFIYLDGSTITKTIDQSVTKDAPFEAVLDKETLTVRLLLNTKKAKFINFGVYIILQRPHPSGKSAYTVLDFATASPKNETYRFDL